MIDWLFGVTFGLLLHYVVPSFKAFMRERRDEA